MRNRIRARALSSYFQHAHDVWNNSLKSCVFLRKNRRAEHCPALREVLSIIRNSSIDLFTANFLCSRYIGNSKVHEEFLQVQMRNRIDACPMCRFYTSFRQLAHQFICKKSLFITCKSDIIFRFCTLFDTPSPVPGRA